MLEPVESEVFDLEPISRRVSVPSVLEGVQVTDHSHTMKYSGLEKTRAVWRCVESDCEFSYSRQLTQEEREELALPEEEPETDFPGDWERVEGT